MANPNRHIGCSGYYYSSWKNQFYPQGLRSAKWLEHYSTIFNTVELNSTFYRQPQLSALKRYAAAVPDGFTFAVKMSRYITHVKRLAYSGEEIAAFQDLIYNGLQDKLGAFLFQLPGSFKYGAENIEHVLANVPSGPQNVIEFRDKSWWNDDTKEALERQSITFCNVDYPGMDVPVMTSSDVFYLRMHGNPILFKSRYTIADLEKFAAAIPKSCQEQFIYFNNTCFDGGYSNGKEMNEILGRKKSKVYA